MIEITQEDRERALGLRTTIEGLRSGGEQALYRSGAYDHTHEVQAFAAHRQQAEDAMKERCAKLAKVATCGCDITERDSKGWPTTLTGAARHMADYIEQQIRGIDTTQAKEVG